MFSKEILYHFVCEKCKGWWSIALTDAWKPSKLYCPHCGYLNNFVVERSIK
jgi:hypothetical protein